MFFYELHEGDDDVFSDLLLVHDEQFEPEDFFELVQAIREKVQPRFEEDTLIEAIAVELERDHGFIYVSDDRLAAAVNVSVVESENYLSELEVELADRAEDDDDDDDDEEDEDVDYKAVIVDIDPSARLN